MLLPQTASSLPGQPSPPTGLDNRGSLKKAKENAKKHRRKTDEQVVYAVSPPTTHVYVPVRTIRSRRKKIGRAALLLAAQSAGGFFIPGGIACSQAFKIRHHGSF